MSPFEQMYEMAVCEEEEEVRIQILLPVIGVE